MDLKAANLKTMNDTALIERTEDLVCKERELLTCVLQHLHEIDRRRLFSEMGYKSLFVLQSSILATPKIKPIVELLP